MIQSLNISHAPGIYEYLSDVNESPDIFFARPTCVQDTCDWVTYLLTSRVHAWVVLHEGTVMGVVTLKDVESGTLQIGFYFRQSARGTGVFKYVKEVANLGNKIIGACRIIATPYPDNIRCQKFLSKMDFVLHEIFDTHHVYAYSF